MEPKEQNEVLVSFEDCARKIREMYPTMIEAQRCQYAIELLKVVLSED